ncbi:MAG: TPM domain-containing protein [Phascolarctobacterium sp.]|nr:TPM domain-containing protein [Phascolarctobacterium sp.]MCD8175763.1 TPM domain-containing protein [Phascolarctobacterium sp.]
MKRWLFYFLLFLQVIFIPCASAIGPSAIPPKPSAADGIYVQDYANVLTATDKHQILSIGQDLDNKTHAQLAVLTIPSLNGEPIDEYALAVLRKWGIGDKTTNSGVLILIAMKDRQSRIEVGYGLEGVLNDALAGRIQDQVMLPFFRQGAYRQGIIQGYVTTASIIAKSAGVELKGTSYSGGARTGYGDNVESYPLWFKLLIGIGIVVLLIIDNLFLGGIMTQMLIFTILRGGGGPRGGGYGGSGGGGGASRRW